MTFLTWLPLATICFLGAITPGPSLALVISNTVAGGTRQGVLTGLGHGLAVGLYALFTALGLALLISQTPWLFAAIQYAGAAFLLYSAVKIIMSKPAVAGDESSHRSRFRGFTGGFLIAFLNPKLALFFLALFSQFITDDQSVADQVIMMLTAGGIDALWYTAVALGIGQTGLLAWLKVRARQVDLASAFVFIGLAIAVVLR
ncbi:MAG: LysE family translocator [Ferrimonas sp.]